MDDCINVYSVYYNVYWYTSVKAVSHWHEHIHHSLCQIQFVQITGESVQFSTNILLIDSLCEHSFSTSDLNIQSDANNLRYCETAFRRQRDELDVSASSSCCLSCSETAVPFDHYISLPHDVITSSLSLAQLWYLFVIIGNHLLLIKCVIVLYPLCCCHCVFVIEFLDKTDRSLAFAVFGATQYNCYPVAIFPVVSGRQSADELLLCFDGFCTFYRFVFNAYW